MKEELKQAIEDAALNTKEATAMLDAINSPSILRHADPDIMGQAGWVRDEEWISVEDRLPEEDQNVLCYQEGIFEPLPSTFQKGCFGKYDDYLMGDRSAYFTYPDVKFWKPFPSNPKK